MSRTIPGPYDADEMRRFLDTFLYREEAFLVDEVIRLDADAKTIEARMDTERPLPLAQLQRNSSRHPPHVAAAELLMVTACLGCMHAWFFHGCRWDEGWAGFGSRIHRADFKRIAQIGPPLRLESSELRTRVGPLRIVMRMKFEFRQGEKLVYVGEQSAMFLKDTDLDSPPG
jgi:hypothetical protein